MIDFQEQTPAGSYFSFPGPEDFEEIKAGDFPLFDLEEYARMIRKYYRIEEKETLRFLSEMPKKL